MQAGGHRFDPGYLHWGTEGVRRCPLFDNYIGMTGTALYIGAFKHKCSKIFGQATKSIRWMPWRQKAMKDVVKLR